MAPADNKQADAFCNHRGANAVMFCRMCYTTKDALAEKGIPRSWNTTWESLYNNNEQQAKRLEVIWKSHGINQYHQVQVPKFDPVKDTPIDILHTVYLGCCKQFLNDVMENNTYSNKELRAKMIEFYRGTDLKGLSC